MAMSYPFVRALTDMSAELLCVYWPFCLHEITNYRGHCCRRGIVERRSCTAVLIATYKSVNFYYSATSFMRELLDNVYHCLFTVLTCLFLGSKTEDEKKGLRRGTITKETKDNKMKSQS